MQVLLFREIPLNKLSLAHQFLPYFLKEMVKFYSTSLYKDKKSKNPIGKKNSY